MSENNEIIEGFRVLKSTSVKLHDFLDNKGISKKKWLEDKIEDDLQHKIIFPNDEFISIAKQHYSRIFEAASIEDAVAEVRIRMASLTNENANWGDYLKFIESFAKMNSLELYIDEDSDTITINMKHDISSHWSDFMELLWTDLTIITKEVKPENCIKNSSSIIMKFRRV
tara:strand:- start:92 stop:601 length:510 start_codon:yes stop_codon:yes gene_type:complete